MVCELRHFDTPLLRFEAIDSTYAAQLNITWINEEKRQLLPLDLEPDGDSLFRWMKDNIESDKKDPPAVPEGLIDL